LSFTAAALGTCTESNTAVRYAQGTLRELTEPSKECGRQVPLYDSSIGFRLRFVVACKTAESSEKRGEIQLKGLLLEIFYSTEPGVSSG
jgi:hypothetical protein